MNYLKQTIFCFCLFFAVCCHAQSSSFTSDTELATHLQTLMSCNRIPDISPTLGLHCKVEFRGLNIEIAGVSSERGYGTIYVHKLGAGQSLHMQGRCIGVDFKESFPSKNPFGLIVLVRDDGVIRPYTNFEFGVGFCGDGPLPT